MKRKFRIPRPRDSTTGGSSTSTYGCTHRWLYTYIYIRRRIRFGVKGQGTHRAARSIARESGSRRRPTFLSGHRSSRIRVLLTFRLFSLSCVSCIRYRRGTSDTLTRGERSNRGELSMLMTRFKGVADFLDIVARGKFRGNLAKRMGIEISANLKVSSGISQTIDRTIFRNSFGVIYK